VVQIVPQLPPPYEGVGTYAAALAGALGGEVRFLVGDPGWSGDRPGGESGAIRAVPARTAEGLAAALAAMARSGEVDAVLLHYANYGYQRRGCPEWLVSGLDHWEGRLVTLFHEVWASGPPWRSSFWLLPAQRRLAARLARRSQALATTLDRYAGMLRRGSHDREIAVLPVFSTVGEPAAPFAAGARARRLVVFGGAGVRGRAYGPFRHALAAAARALAAEEVWDVGPPLSPPASVAGVPVRPLGVLAADEVSAVLLGSAAGFLAYPPEFLPKSTVFAAYCAHGMLPVCAWTDHPAATGVPYWRGDGGDPGGDPDGTARAAHDWYAGHSLRSQAATFRRLLAGGAAE
jgi:hypothetical protein